MILKLREALSRLPGSGEAAPASPSGRRRGPRASPLILPQLKAQLFRQLDGWFSLLFRKIRFMLETMLALKNNDMRKIPGYDPEPVERLRKAQRALVRRGPPAGPSPAASPPPGSRREPELGARCPVWLSPETKQRLVGDPISGPRPHT